MDIPEKFPDGCQFGSSFGGDEFVRFPDGQWYILDELLLQLSPIGMMTSKGSSSNEEYFQNCGICTTL